MHRRLVKLDPFNGGRFSEVDPICLKRETLALKNYVEENISPDNDEYDVRGQVLPLCQGVLDGTLTLPLNFADLPLKYPKREGLLPPEFIRPWAYFCVTATGSLLDEPNIVLIDGQEYAEMVFEDPGDWPHVVKQYEEARRRERMGADYVPVSL